MMFFKINQKRKYFKTTTKKKERKKRKKKNKNERKKSIRIFFYLKVNCLEEMFSFTFQQQMIVTWKTKKSSEEVIQTFSLLEQ